jgi:hypothetical protein
MHTDAHRWDRGHRSCAASQGWSFDVHREWLCRTRIIGVHRWFHSLALPPAALALRHVAWIRPVNVRRDVAGACTGAWGHAEGLCPVSVRTSAEGHLARRYRFRRVPAGRQRNRARLSVVSRLSVVCRQGTTHAVVASVSMNVSLYDGRDSAAWHANWSDYTRVGVRFEDDLRLVPARYAGNYPKDPCGQGSARGCVRPGSVFTVLSLYVSVLKILAMPHPAPATGTIRSLCAETPCAITAEFPPKRVVGDGRPLR